MRQICIWKSLGEDAWWEYTEEFGLQCLKWDDENCSDKVMTIIGWSDQKATVQKCMDDSFGSKTPDYSMDDNKLLQNEIDSYGESAVQYWPAVIINHSQYKVD